MLGYSLLLSSASLTLVAWINGEVDTLSPRASKFALQALCYLAFLSTNPGRTRNRGRVMLYAGHPTPKHPLMSGPISRVHERFQPRIMILVQVQLKSENVNYLARLSIANSLAAMSRKLGGDLTLLDLAPSNVMWNTSDEPWLPRRQNPRSQVATKYICADFLREDSTTIGLLRERGSLGKN